MTKLGPPPETLEGLQRENKMLRTELQRRIKSEERANEIKKRALKTSGSLLFTIFDRKKILTNFQRLFETVSRFSGPSESWPSRDEIIADSKALSLSYLRFMIRRRTIMFLISMAAFLIPMVQIYLVYQQNVIIENQNKFFELQVYDLVARSMASEQMSAKQMTGALLARSDLPFFAGIVEEVFGEDRGRAFTASRSADIDFEERALREAAFRGHLVLGLARAADLNAENMSISELYDAMRPLFVKVMEDAARRVPAVFKVSRSTALADDDLAEEVYRYVINLGALMKKQWSLALAADEEEDYFKTIEPLIRRAPPSGSGLLAERSPFAKPFYDVTLRELILDLALEPQFGEPSPPTPKDTKKALADGFNRMKQKIGDKRISNDDWNKLKRLAGVR